MQCAKPALTDHGLESSVFICLTVDARCGTADDVYAPSVTFLLYFLPLLRDEVPIKGESRANRL